MFLLIEWRSSPYGGLFIYDLKKFAELEVPILESWDHTDFSCVQAFKTFDQALEKAKESIDEGGEVILIEPEKDAVVYSYDEDAEAE